MFEPKTVKKGDTGLSVLLLQEILIARGFKGKDGKPLTLDTVSRTNYIPCTYQIPGEPERRSGSGRYLWRQDMERYRLHYNKQYFSLGRNPRGFFLL